jgi:hypothetical protein
MASEFGLVDMMVARRAGARRHRVSPPYEATTVADPAHTSRAGFRARARGVPHFIVIIGLGVAVEGVSEPSPLSVNSKYLNRY